MAELIIEINKIKENIRSLSDFFEERGTEWSLITKVFSGDHDFLVNILTNEVISKINSVGDSRLTSLKNLRAVNPTIRTIYIKPPAAIYADELVRYADISLNSSLSTIKALNEAAGRAGKIHQIIIMVELGEMREGVNRGDVISFYEKVFDLPYIEVIGLGSNLGCMYGIEPTYDKLLLLSNYKAQISKRFNKELKYISAGTSITLPLVEMESIPLDINHFRVGEAVFFGTSPLFNKQFLTLHTDTFHFEANIIELREKKIVPEGILGDANIGHTAGFEGHDASETTVKAILDVGMLDVDKDDIEAYDEEVHFVGITSDMMVVDIGDNRTSGGVEKYHVGDCIRFKTNYMAVARMLNSKFIDRRFV